MAAELASLPRVITYNGRGFDMPLLTTRLTVHRLFRELASLPEQHDDLLPVASRLYRRPLGGARLADVEAGVLGVVRSSDCPGSEVPSRYFGYLRGGPRTCSPTCSTTTSRTSCRWRCSKPRWFRCERAAGARRLVLDPHGMAVELLRHGATDEALEVVEAAMQPGVEQEQRTPCVAWRPASC